jgi:NAD(P)H-hydrate epimerase
MVTEAMTVGLPETEEGVLDNSALDVVLALIKDKRCLAVGPGIGIQGPTGALLSRLIETCAIPMVIDADGLNLMAAQPYLLPKRQAPIILTPHPGEMARLSGHSVADIQSDRIGHARAFAERHQVFVVLKGAATVIAQPDGIVFINATGNPGMASGGMGDVLTGLIAGLITQGMQASAAARAGVYLHGLAADRLAKEKGPFGYLATEVMNTLPETMGELLNGNEIFPWPSLDPLLYSTEQP